MAPSTRQVFVTVSLSSGTYHLNRDCSHLRKASIVHSISEIAARKDFGLWPCLRCTKETAPKTGGAID